MYNSFGMETVTIEILLVIGRVVSEGDSEGNVILVTQPVVQLTCLPNTASKGNRGTIFLKLLINFLIKLERTLPYISTKSQFPLAGLIHRIK